jgi:transposase-like protein
MVEGISEQLKAPLQHWWEHVQAAISRGVTIAEYARAEQLDSEALYRWRALFRRQGRLTAAEPKKAPRSASTGDSGARARFSAVRVTGSSAVVTISVGALLQVQCASWPSPQWLAELSHCLQERV